MFHFWIYLLLMMFVMKEELSVIFSVTAVF